MKERGVLQNTETWGVIKADQYFVKPRKSVTLPVGEVKAQETQAFSVYVEAWRGRLARQASEQQMWAQHLREIAQCCAEHLVQDFGASKVYLFGSLLEDDLIHDRSDIDLAVEGLEGRLYFKALRDIWELLPEGVELELVLLESSWPGLAERVETEGVLLDAAA
jgi:predicted nucleotidyltransferase